jgi:hypothetical protein
MYSPSEEQWNKFPIEQKGWEPLMKIVMSIFKRLKGREFYESPIGKKYFLIRPTN